MSFFSSALLRLKEQLQVQSDKEVAELLGISPTAFADRKKRDAFPEDKLFAFAAKHPERKIDVAYVITGTPALIHGVMADIKAAAEISSRLGGGGERLAAAHASIRGARLTLDDVHRAIIDAVDLLSLEKKVDAQQLAKLVVRLCQPSEPKHQGQMVAIQHADNGVAQQINGPVQTVVQSAGDRSTPQSASSKIKVKKPRGTTVIGNNHGVSINKIKLEKDGK